MSDVVKTKGRQRHVLLVEDNPGDILLIKESFKAAAGLHQLTVARDGQEALDFVHGIGPYAGASLPDLVLLDLNLPKVSGIEVLTRLKSNTQFQKIPVVVLSTSSAPQDIERAYELAANCYLCKPDQLEDFFHLMDMVQEFWLQLARTPSEPFTCRS